MPNKTARKKKTPAQKSIFRKAGEAIGAIGHEIVEGKDKLVEASEAAVEKISDIKATITKKIAAAPAKKSVKKKATAAKRTAKQLVKKAAKKIISKAKKAVPKKSPAKKTAKKK